MNLTPAVRTVLTNRYRYVDGALADARTDVANDAERLRQARARLAELEQEHAELSAALTPGVKNPDSENEPSADT